MKAQTKAAFWFVAAMVQYGPPICQRPASILDGALRFIIAFACVRNAIDELSGDGQGGGEW